LSARDLDDPSHLDRRAHPQLDVRSLKATSVQEQRPFGVFVSTTEIVDDLYAIRLRPRIMQDFPR